MTAAMFAVLWAHEGPDKIATCMNWFGLSVSTFCA